MTTRDPGPITPADWIASEKVFRHAQAKGKVLAPGAHVRAVVKCNQLRMQDLAPCDWSRTIETVAVDVDTRVTAALVAHLSREHRGVDPVTMAARRTTLLHDI